MPGQPNAALCSYIKLTGDVCGLPGTDGLCKTHLHCNPHRHCINCGRGTNSKTGYCNIVGPCQTAQRTVNIRAFYARVSLRKKALVATAVANKKWPTVRLKKVPGVSDAELDTYVSELLAELGA
jgi:hypothetical protein